MSDALNSYRDGNKRSCLVTGATGLVGNNVVRKFLETGWNVRVLVRPHHLGTTAALEGLPVEKFIGQLEDTSSLQKAVDGIDFDIKSGETLGLVGQSGCGKTTTARALCLLDPKSSGSVNFWNTESEKMESIDELDDEGMR